MSHRPCDELWSPIRTAAQQALSEQEQQRRNRGCVYALPRWVESTRWAPCPACEGTGRARTSDGVSVEEIRELADMLGLDLEAARR